ncbi:MAG: IscS subfamily cysteine desulfurase [Spirochaetota bacterium]
MAVREKRGICGICAAGCWIIAEYDKNGKIVKVRPDEDTRMGMTCRIGDHSPDIIYSENRVLYPQKRVGPKGSYEFERISWDEAYDIIVDKFQHIKKHHGGEATAIYTGVGTFELAYCDIFQPKNVMVSSASSVLFPFGSPNTMGVGALCYVAYGMIAPHVTCGKILNEMFNDVENAEMVVIWGTNPATDLPPVDMKRIMAARERGAEVIVIDPRRTAAVKLTDGEWIPIRPGTDGALALGMCNVLIEEELYDENFVNNWTVGFDEFSRYVQHFRPEVVEEITGIPAERVVSLARRIARARGVTQHMYTGLEYSNSGVQNIRASIVLWALAGQLDVPGGRCFMMPGNSFPINRDGLIGNPDVGVRLGRDRFPVYVKYRDEAHAIALPESVLEGKPYKIRGMIIQGASITTSWPNPELWRKTLNELEFLVCIDRQMTADAAYADIVLPASTFYEIESYMVYGPIFRLRERMIEPQGESRGDVEILTELAARLGYGHLYPQGEEAVLRHVLKGSGFTLEEVRKQGGMVSKETGMLQYRKWEKGLLRADDKPGFDTPSGKFEIASAILEEYGYDPLPVYTEPAESPRSRPDLAGPFPLVFNSGARMRSSFHTQHHGIKNLNKESPEPVVTLSRPDADARDISQGDRVRISTPRGSVVMRAIVTDDMAPGFIDANHACGSPVGPKEWRETNINDLTDLDNYDPVSGFPVYKSLLCQVTKEENAADMPYALAGEITQEEFAPGQGEQLKKREVYLDWNATTPMAPEVKETMMETLELYGNPSSIHGAGIGSRKVMEGARRMLADALNTTSRRIIFTGGGSEANNLAIKGTGLAPGNTKRHIITSSIEHPAVSNTCDWMEEHGFTVTRLPVDRNGLVSPGSLEKAIGPHTCLVSIMLANNETGVIQPVKELAAIARSRGVLFHTDAVQAFGKIPVNVQDLGVDMLTVSAHKIRGPKGVGALYVGREVPIEPLIHGGGQEYGARSGTENIAGIAGFGKAVELLHDMPASMHKIRRLRDELQDGILSMVEDSRLNGDAIHRLPNTLNVTLPGYRGESVVLSMSRYCVYFSSGSACSSASSAPSAALLAMGLSEEEAHCSLRLSLGILNNEDDITYTLDRLKTTLEDSRKIVHFVPCR